MDAVLCSVGHVASTATLFERGVTARQLREALARGVIHRLRRGTYACAHLDADLTRVATVGGALTCISVLRQHGVWAGHSRELHVQLPPNSTAAPARGLKYHWERPRFGMEHPWRASRMQALWQAIRCLDHENALAAMESAVHEGFLTWDEVLRLAAHAPRALQPDIHAMIPNSGSGNETIVRYRLLRVGYRVEPQGYVPGLGHQDLVIEDCVGLDIDGRKWHEHEDRFAIDRDRDVHSEGLGRHVLRLRPAHIFETWPHTLSVIDRVVADARRLRQWR